MEKDLIENEINLWRRKLDHIPSYNEYVNFYKSSIFLSKPFKIFENKFNLFWTDAKQTTLSHAIPAKSDFDFEGYLKSSLFRQFADTLRADFDFFYIKNGRDYIINEEKEQLLWDEIGNLFFIPKILLLVSGKKEKALLDIINKLKIENEEKDNKRRTYSIQLMKMINEIEITSKPKKKQFQCLIEANRIIKEFEESDLIHTATGEPTELSFSIISSYKSQKKSLPKPPL